MTVSPDEKNQIVALVGEDGLYLLNYYIDALAAGNTNLSDNSVADALTAGNWNAFEVDAKRQELIDNNIMLIEEHTHAGNIKCISYIIGLENVANYGAAMNVPKTRIETIRAVSSSNLYNFKVKETLT